MKKTRQAVELWAHNIIDRLQKTQTVEDDLVELKQVFIEPYEAARRIAGHANAARGEPILWIFGVHDKTGTVFGVQDEFSTWWAQVKSHFDGRVPDIYQDMTERDGLSVATLYMDTSACPFVIKNKFFGKTQGEVKFEVPWREGTAVRTASRLEMLRILVPVQALPDWTVLSCRMEQGPTQFSFETQLYMAPRTSERVFIPLHQCAARVRHESDTIRADSITLYNTTENHPRGGDNLVVKISAPCRLVVVGTGSADLRPLMGQSVQLHLEMTPALGERTMVVTSALSPAEPRDPNIAAAWRDRS